MLGLLHRLREWKREEVERARSEIGDVEGELELKNISWLYDDTTITRRVPCVFPVTCPVNLLTSATINDPNDRSYMVHTINSGILRNVLLYN